MPPTETLTNLPPEALDQIFRTWCEANPSIMKATVRQAEERLKGLEQFWRSWKAVCASNGWDRSMPDAFRAMHRSDKSIIPGLADKEASANRENTLAEEDI